MAAPSRAAKPRPPLPSRALQQARRAAEIYRSGREAPERASVVRGVLFVVGAVLLFSVARAGTARVFPAGWWRW